MHGARRRRSAASLVCGLIGAAALVSVAPAAVQGVEAADGPHITSLVDGQEVAGRIEVIVESPAPWVLIGWEAELGVRDELRPRETTAGVVTQRLSTWSHAGLEPVVARECTSNALDSCTGAQTSVQLMVANPAPEWDDDRWFDELHGQAVIILRADEPPEEYWEKYGFFVDGEPVTMWNEPFFPLYTDDLLDGTHTVRAARCAHFFHNDMDFSACDMANASEERAFVLRTALNPVITQVRPQTFSPDSNGFHDRATVTVALEKRQVLSWSILDGPRILSHEFIGLLEAGTHTFGVDGLDFEGRPLPSGNYQLQVHSFSEDNPPPEIDDRLIFGLAATGIGIDLYPPRVTSVAVRPGWFHPPVDGYRDHVRISGVLSEAASRFRIELKRRGVVVRRLFMGPDRAAGGFAATWNGRRRSGRLVRPGFYRYWFMIRDRAGNTTSQVGGRIEVRWRR